MDMYTIIPLASSPLAPLFSPLQLTWNPPCCDRIRPPRSQVACKLTPLFPSPGSYIPLPKIPTPPGFSRSKYTFIRTTLRTQPIKLAYSLNTVIPFSHSIISVNIQVSPCWHIVLPLFVQNIDELLYFPG
jgi:hypothetical protein